MKALFCQDCGDIVSPGRGNLNARWCDCRRHGTWWADGGKEIIKVYDVSIPLGARQGGRAHPMHPACWILGIHNGLLKWEGGFTAKIISQMLDDTPETYLFKIQRSLIVRFRPGETGDSSWALSLPTDTETK